LGAVVSFYSDRDGIGRSMAVASVAWILATNGRRVAVVDWDLQKPSLHKYLEPFLLDPGWRDVPGVIDFLWQYAQSARRASTIDVGALRQEPAEVSGCTCGIPADLRVAPGGHLHFIPAGAARMGAIRLRYFNWSELVDRLGGVQVVKGFLDKVAAEYNYVLVDLPSGRMTLDVTLPAFRSDSLVACFTLDHESIDVVSARARWLTDRLGNTDIAIIPVAMLVEPAEKDITVQALDHAYKRFSALRRRGWETIEIPEVPFYKNQRVLPTVLESRRVRGGLVDQYLRLAANLVSAADLDLRIPTSDYVREYLDELSAASPNDDESAYTSLLPRPYQGDEPYAFLSYAREDRDEVLTVIKDLAELGFRIWWDEEIIGGTDWQSYLKTKIHRCSHILLFISGRSMTSRYVEQELRIASEFEKPVLGVRWEWTDLNPTYKGYVSRYQILERDSPTFEEDLGRAMGSLNPTVGISQQIAESKDASLPSMAEE
jgi:MinD-like ATPase involved in chromosome partitioning or flagellar assembly